MLILLSPAGLELRIVETGTTLASDGETAPLLSAEEIDRLMTAAPRFGITIFPPNNDPQFPKHRR